MKLGLEQIQFIDNYLENSDIIHVDIRSEMIDHVASGIEAKMNEGDIRDFYFIFKDYMVEHKYRLLKSNKKFIQLTDKKITKAIFKNALTWQGILVFLLSFSIFQILNFYFESNTIEPLIIGLPMIGSILFAILYFFGIKFYQLNRYSGVERIGFVAVILFHLFSFFWNISGGNVQTNEFFYMTLMISFSIVLLYALVRVTFNMTSSYKAKFKNFV